MSGGLAWQGDWKARLHRRVRERGFSSLTAFATARPAVPLLALAEELGAQDIAGVQILSELFAEAERRRHVMAFVRDILVRELAECLPDGWPALLDDAQRFKVAKALGSWIASTPPTHKEQARQARTALLAAPPPAGWCPSGPDDELLRMLLPDESV